MPTDSVAIPTRRVPPPEQLSPNPARRLREDILTELRVRRNGGYPPGAMDFDLGRTLRMAHDPLPILLSLYERYGPIFSVRILHHPVVFMLGPEANQFVTVTHPENFHWREGPFIAGRSAPRST